MNESLKYNPQDKHVATKLVKFVQVQNLAALFSCNMAVWYY